MINADALDRAAMKARIARDISDLNTGQRAALIHLRFEQGLQTSQLGDLKLIRALEAELPAKAMLETQETGAVAVWVPRTTYSDTATTARLLRQVALQHKTPDSNAEHQFPTERRFAIGVALVDHPNWQTDALIGPAEVTSAMALLAGVHQIKFARQVRAGV